MSVNIKPLHDYVLVLPVEENLSSGGIVIPDTVDKARSQKGKVCAIGSGKVCDGEKVDLTVKIDDVVLFGKYSGSEIELDGKKYLIMKESDILAIIA